MTEELQEAVDGFFLAAEYGRSDVIQALAEHGRDQLSLADVVDPVTGRSPLHVAVASGKKDAVRVLLAAGFPPEHQSKQSAGKSIVNRSAYALAQQLKAHDLLMVFHHFLIQQVAANDVQSVHQLLQAGVDVGVTDAATGGSLLHWAASCQAVDVMEFLLARDDVQQRELVNARNSERATPLHLACHANNVEGTKMLLLHHANRHLKGGKGLSKDKTAPELATAQAVKVLFSLDFEHANGTDKTKASMQNEGLDVTSAREHEEVSCALVARATDRRETETCLHGIQNGLLLVRLEEKDLLVNQLKKTIDALVQEAQEAQMLGEERVMLDYVRKLRNEKAIVQRQLHDAMESLGDQSQQLDSLKAQIRQMSMILKQQTKTDHDDLSHTSNDTASDVAAGTPDSSHTNMSVLDLHELQSQEIKRSHRPQAHPLKLDAWTSKTQREKETINRYGANHGSDSWSTVWYGLWTGGDNSEAQDEDDEVIMTV